MNTINLKLYDLLRKDFNLSEEKAKAFAAAIEETAKENSTIESTKYKSELKEDLLKLELRLELKIEQSKNENIKWMFGFWVTLVLLILANWFFKK